MRLTIFIAALCAMCAQGQVMISGNEYKVDLTTGAPKFIAGAKPDTLTVLNFSSFPPAVSHIEGVSNSVIGPPSNVAVAPDDSIALVADSIQQDPANPAKYAPANKIRVIDLRANPPAVVQEIESGRQPSGMSIARDDVRDHRQRRGLAADLDLADDLHLTGAG